MRCLSAMMTPTVLARSARGTIFPALPASAVAGRRAVLLSQQVDEHMTLPDMPADLRIDFGTLSRRLGPSEPHGAAGAGRR
jgi:hypothetical protein